MAVPFRTFAFLGLALGMLAAGYLFAPAPGASQPGPPAVKVASAPEPAAKAEPAGKPGAPTLVANRPPVPLMTHPKSTFARPESSDRPAGASAKATPSESKPSETGDRVQALTAAPGGGGDDSQARRAVEFDGYRNVRGLVKGSDGIWHGRAMRGRTEIAVRVDASGNVSAE
jgi:hypothetical protein